MNESVVIKFIADNKDFVKGTDDINKQLEGVHKTAHNVMRAIEIGAVAGIGLIASKSALVRTAWHSAGGFVTNTLTRMGFQADRIFGGLSKGANTVARNVIGMNSAFTIAEKGLMGLGIAAVASMGFAVKQAADFEVSMRNVNSILGLSEPSFKKLQQNVLNIAKTLPVTGKELAEGMYQVVSSGFTTGAGSTKVITAAAKAAKAGLTDTATAATALTTAMNSYNMTADKAGYVSDLLFQTVNVGVVNFEQLSQNLGDFVGTAQAAGISLEEILGVYATITTATGQPNRAATNTQGIARALIKPSQELSMALDKLGYKSGPAAVKGMGGLLPVIRALYDMVGKNKDAMAPLFQDTEALSGVFALLSKTQGQVDKQMAQFTDRAKVSGVTERVLAEQSKSWNYQMAQIKASLGASAIQMGQAFLPALKLATSFIGFFIRQIASAPDWLKKTFGWITVVGGSLLTFSAGWAMVSTHLKTFKLVLGVLTDTPILGWLKAQLQTLPLVGNAYQAASAKVALFKTSLMGIGLILTGIIAGLEIRDKISQPLIDAVIGKQDIGDVETKLMKVGTSVDKILATTGKFGLHGKDALKQFIGDVDRLGQSLVGRQLSMGYLKVGVQRVDELDKALANLAESGHADLAAQQFAALKDELVGAGVSQKSINKAFNDYLKVIGATVDEHGNLKDSGEAMAQAMLEDFNKMKQAAQDYANEVKNLMQQATDFVGLKTILENIQDTHDKAADSAKKEGEAIDGITEAQDKLNAAKDKEMDAQKKIDRLRYVTNNAPIAGSDTARKLAEAERDLRDAKREQTKATQDSNAENKKTPATLNEVLVEMQKQMDTYNTFQDNLRKLASRGLDPAAIEQLRGMGKEGATLADQMLKASPKEFEKSKGLLAENARMQGEEYQRELDKQLRLAEAIAKLGSAATVDAIIKEMERLAPGINAKASDVYNSAKTLGIYLATGVVDGMATIGNKGITVSFSAITDQIGPAALGGAGTVTAGGLSAGAVGASALQRDSGGPLPPGYSTVFNGTGKTEWVFTPEQARRLSGLGDTPATGGSRVSKKNIYQFGDIHAADMTDVMRKAEQARRLRSLEGMNA